MPDSRDSRRYLFLMRHARHVEGQLTKDGTAHVKALAARFAEWMQAEWRDHPERTVRFWCATTAPEVHETADQLLRDLPAESRREGGAESSVADPRTRRGAVGGGQPQVVAALPATVTQGRDLEKVLTAYSPDEPTFRMLCDWLDAIEVGEQQARRTDVDAPLLVGNDPLIGWLAGELTGRGMPVARGELLCLVCEPRSWQGAVRAIGAKTSHTQGRWRLLWTISEDAEAEAEAIRTKIKSKMNTAGALGTVIVGLSTFLLQNALQKQPSAWQWLAFASLGMSAALYFATMFLYDTLQMPPRFWASRFPTVAPDAGGLRAVLARIRHGKPSVRRPPSSTARVLQTNMVRVWAWIFTPATVLAGVGVACLALSAASGASNVPVRWQPGQILLGIAVLAAVVAGWVAWQRPNLGASD